MYKSSFAIVALVALAMFGCVANPAHADGFGIYFSSGSHCGEFGHHGGSYRGWRGGYGNWHRGYGWHGDHDWHDTSHYDYHPGGFVRHRNHFHYAPGHYDYHPSGHWDHYHW